MSVQVNYRRQMHLASGRIAKAKELLLAIQDTPFKDKSTQGALNTVCNKLGSAFAWLNAAIWWEESYKKRNLVNGNEEGGEK